MTNIRKILLTGLAAALVLLAACSGPSPQSSGFTLQLSNGSLTLAPGEAASVTVTVKPSGDFDQAVVLSLTGDTGGVTTAFEPSSTKDESTLTLSVAADAATGERKLKAQGSGGGQTASADFTLTVQAAGEQNPALVERYSSERGEFKTVNVNGIELTYELIDGLAIYQGDMILGSPQDVIDLLNEKAGLTAQGIGLERSSRRWTGGIVPYEINESSYNPTELSALRSVIARVADHFATNTSIRLVPRRGQSDYIRIENTSDPLICGSSALGRQGGRQTLFMRCGYGTLIHELNHALGVGHEQSREDRNSFVTINFSNLAATDLRYNFDQNNSLFADAGGYDYDSIMHYPAFIRSWSRDPSIPLIVPIDASVPLSRLGQRDGLSLSDWATLCELYGTQASARILGPSNGATFTEGDSVELYGRYTLRGVEEAARMRWSSSLDGDIRTVNFPGETRISVADLSPGVHTLTLEALRGCPGVSDTVTITVVAESSPTITIDNPSEGDTLTTYNRASLRSSKNSVLDGATVTWTSDLDGAMGTGDTLPYTFRTVGAHRITATARKDGLEVSDTVDITVETDTPEVVLLSPSAGRELCQGDPLTLQASVSDRDGTIADSQVRWSVAGVEVARGLSATYTPTTLGSLTLNASAQDAYGASGSDSVNVIVVDCPGSAPTVVINEPALESGQSYAFISLGDQGSDSSGIYADIVLRGTATDPEDGSLPASGYAWYTDNAAVQPGPPASGEQLVLSGNNQTVRLYRPADCSSGGGFSSELLLRLQVTDSDGNPSSVTRRVVFECLG